MTTPVLLDVADGIAKVTLNRPDKGNALDQPMADALLDAALAAQLSEGAVGAMGQARKLLHDSFNSGFASQMDRELVFSHRCRKRARGARRHRCFPDQTQTGLSGWRVSALPLSTPQETSL